MAPIDAGGRLTRIVVTGSECTGKTTLARALAEHYDTIWIPEYARQFVRQKGAHPEYADVEAIARGQIRSEDAAATTDQVLLVQDTDPLGNPQTLARTHNAAGFAVTHTSGAGLATGLALTSGPSGERTWVNSFADGTSNEVSVAADGGGGGER